MKKDFRMIFALVLYPFMYLLPAEIITLEFMGFWGHIVCLLYVAICGFAFAAIGLWVNVVVTIIAIVISIIHYPLFMTVILIAVPLLYLSLTVLPTFFSKDK